MIKTMRLCVLVTSFIVGVLGIAFLNRVEAEDSITPTHLTFVFVRPRNDPMTKWLILIYTEALKRMDIEFLFKDVPPKRAGVYSDAGDVDGELGRAYTYNETHPNLIRVEENNNITNFSAFTSDPLITLHGWTSFQGTTYLVDYRRGIAVCETQLPRVVHPHRLSAVTKVNQGIRKLLNGRTQVYVDVEAFVMDYLKSEEFQKISMGRKVYNAGVMQQTSGHAFLHKKHKSLVPKLSAILHQMKKEGLFEAYRNQVGMTADDVTW